MSSSLVTQSASATTPGRSGRSATRSALPLLLILLVGVAAPLVAVLIRAVTGYDGQPSALPELAEPRNLRILGNTVLLGVLVVFFSALMAAPLAFLMSWTRMRRHRWIDVVLMIPFMTPPYVAAIAWLDFVRINGLAEQLLGPLGVAVREGIESPVGMALVMASESFTFLYLILRTHLESIPASLDESASVSGASSWQRLRRILLPLSTPAFSVGALIIFIRAAGEFGTPVTMGNKIGFPVLVSEIYTAVTIYPLNFPTAAAFSSVLLTLGIIVWALQQWVSRNPLHFGGRVARRATVTLGPVRAAAGWVWLGLVALVSVVIPYISIILGSMTILRSKPLTLDNLTFEYFGIVLGSSSGMGAIQTSATLSFISATIAVILGIACALVIARLRRRAMGRAIDLLAVASDTVPAIVLAIGFIFFWNAPWWPISPYNTAAMVVIGYIVILLPMVVQNIKTSRESIDDRLLEAATISGGTAWQTLRRVTLPLLVPGIVSGWLLAFLLGFREVVVSSLVRPASLNLISPWILSHFDQGLRAEALAMTLVGVVGSTVVLVVVDTIRRRGAERRLA